MSHEYSFVWGSVDEDPWFNIRLKKSILEAYKEGRGGFYAVFGTESKREDTIKFLLREMPEMPCNFTFKTATIGDIAEDYELIITFIEK